MKSCELCKLAARTYCESDQANLCWDCDAKVHGANFLAARHVRCLLCHACRSRTPWRATGSKLGHTVTVCEMCVNGGDREGSEAENDDEDDDEEEADSDDDVLVGDDGEEDGDNNQVVPWSTISNTSLPACSSSSSEDSAGGELEVSKSKIFYSLKRLRENASDIRSQVDLDRLSTKRRYGYRNLLATGFRPEEEAVSVDSLGLSVSEDQQTKPEGTVQFPSDSRGTASTALLGEKN